MSVSALRTSIAAALENPSVWSVYAFPPASPTANSVILQPSDPYIMPTNQKYNTVAAEISFKITCIVPMFDNLGNLSGIEDFMVAVFNKISATHTGFRVGDFSAPMVLPTDAGQMLAADFTITTMISWS